MLGKKKKFPKKLIIDKNQRDSKLNDYQFFSVGANGISNACNALCISGENDGDYYDYQLFLFFLF